MIGKTMSHYKIHEKLGEGGMGVVYKAEDTKLNRTVALKFLSTNQLATDDEKQRFEQEAKAAAQLSHANIAHVYEINEHEGQTFIAMEYIEGETIADMIKDRPLKIKEAIKIAQQIAEGLHSAHELGIVHRDIKSANVMITNKGVAKIMDFGLAKMSAASMLTKAGTTLGTIAYMSPEQSQGEKVDHRADIWSLGVVLYEMISGQLPFRGDYESAIVYSIMNEPPEPLTAVRTGVPMKLEEIVNKLLAKDRDERYQNIIELPVDLKNVSLQDTATSRIRSSAITDSIREEKKLTVEVKYSYKTILKIAALIIPTFILSWFLKPGPRLPYPKRLNKTVLTLPENTTLRSRPGQNRMAISPDGMDVVYIAERSAEVERLFLKRAGSFDMTELEGTLHPSAPFFSPDGRWIGYINHATNDIHKVLADGGEPFKITSFTGSRGSATWAPDNTIIFEDERILKRIPESGGEPAVLTKTKTGPELHLYPHMLPDGKTVLFTVGNENAELNTYRLAVFRFGDDDHRIILDEEGYYGVYSHSGHILYGRSSRLMAVSFDLQNLKVAGTPVPVLGQVRTLAIGSMSYALSKEGTIIYVPGIESDGSHYSVLNVDLSGRATKFFDLKRGFQFARYSPDGKYVGFIIEEANGDANIWMYHIRGGALNQLTFYNGRSVWRFAWSPDSKKIAYATMAEDSTNSIFIKRIDGTGTAEKIFTVPKATQWTGVKDWSSDGDKISFDHPVGSFNYDLFVYSFREGGVKPYLASPAFEVEPFFSPNGKWLVYQAGPGTNEIYVRPYPESSGGLWKISNGGGQKPVWSRDGKRIYYRGGQVDAMYAVDVTATDIFTKGNPRKIFEGNYFLSTGRRFDINPDGKSFIMIQPDVGPQAQRILVIQNFDEELKRLAPVK
jgi:serine/threonine-protein kinase